MGCFLDKPRNDSGIAIATAVLIIVRLVATAYGGDDLEVARVNSDGVYLSEIRSSDEAILQGRKMAREMGMKFSNSPLSESRMEEIRTEKAIGLLRSRMEQIIYFQKLAEYGITVSEEEENAKLIEIHGTADTDSVSRMLQSYMASLSEALREVYETGEHPDSSYAHHLKGFLDPQGWENELNSYADSSRRAGLREIVGMMSSQPGRSLAEDARQWVRQDKMDAIIDEEIAKENEDYREFLEQRRKGRWDEKFPFTYDGEMRNNWWREQYQEANIEILDERYKKALDILRGTGQ